MLINKHRIITETIVTFLPDKGNIIYKDEFPNSIILSRVINYLLDKEYKIGFIKSINIQYKEITML